MKRKLLDSLQQSFRFGLSALTVLSICVAVSALASAQEKNDAKTDSSADEIKSPGKTQNEVIAGDSVTLGSTELGARNEKIVKEVDPLMTKGADALKAGKYKDAIDSYKQALEIANSLGNGQYITSKRAKINEAITKARQTWATALMNNARNTYSEALVDSDKKMSADKYNTAITMANNAKAVYYCGKIEGVSAEDVAKASEKNPTFGTGVDAFVKDCNRMLKAMKFREDTALENVDKGNKERKEKIDILIKQGEILYKNQEYAKVRDNMELVLVMDPYNQRAVNLLNKTYKKLYKIADLRRENEILDRMADVEWKWNEAVLPTGKVAPKETPIEKKNTSQSTLYEKLQKIIFNEIRFEDNAIDVQGVLQYLSVESKNFDPEGVGVSIIPPSDAISRERRIPMLELSHVPMLEVIKYVCQLTNLRFKVEDKAVIVGSQEGIINTEMGFFQVRAALISRISGGASDTEEAKTDAGGGKTGVRGRFEGLDLKGSLASEKLKEPPTATSEALMKYFSERGIPFDQGSSIYYDKRASKLIVNNTSENLLKLERLLRDIDVSTPLVLIEAKILEITMTDLEELGFDWVLTYNGTNPMWSFANMTAYTRDSGETNTLINNMNILPNVGGDNAFNLFMTVKALDQTSRAEVLSTPKVMATTGTAATLTVAEEMYFPDSWNEPEVEVSNGTYSYSPSYPEFGEAVPVGTVFTVTPDVAPNNYTIALTLHPDVSKLIGWSNYDYEIIIGNTSSPTNTLNPKIKMPILARREVETKIKVYDGETIVIGGIMEDVQAQGDDKYPVLGDIPLVGRLFTSQYSKTEKANLIMFVTARLINNDGVPVRSNPGNALFDFNR